MNEIDLTFDNSTHQHIGVIGAGAWGTAIAHIQAEAGRQVTLWARDSDLAAALEKDKENKKYLPGIALHPSITYTSDLKDLAACTVLMIVTPAQAVRKTLEDFRPHYRDGVPIVLCSKGIELDTGWLLSRVVEETYTDVPLLILSGPNFAHDIAALRPGAATLGSKSKEFSKLLSEALACRTFRLYSTDDVIGVQLGGALKNVIAIAAGVVMGKGLGESTRAALIARGIAEMARLVKAMGGKPDTLMGQCGIGDLTASCTSMASRNYSLGFALGEGKSLEDILADRQGVTEGIHTAKALAVLAKKNAVDMPIAQAVRAVVSGEQTIDEAIDKMLDRPVRAEGV